MQIDRRYFEGLLRDKGMSLRALAKLMGMGHSQLSLTFGGERRLQLDEAIQLATIFGVPLAQIVQAMGLQPAQAGELRVSVIGSVLGDGTVRPHDHGAVDRTTAPAGVPGDGLAVQFRTAGTALEWLDATVMFCAKPDGIYPAAIGRLCLVQIKDGPMAVATVRRGYAENSYNLTGPCTRDSARLEFAAPVLFSRH
jgi:transcriptional regulator with XRE-family HTH domain